MTGWTELARTTTQNGDVLVLRECAGVVEIRCNGWDLMSNRAHHSEEELARLACARLADAARDPLSVAMPRVLIGGLGMGFTLRAALDVLPITARILVAELLPAVIAWNRGPLADLAHRPLDDPRVSVVCADVAAVLADVRDGFDAVLLDVDNGPGAVMLAENQPLYQSEGLRVLRAALRPGGVLAVWSADRAAGFEDALSAAGFDWDSAEVAARGAADDPRHSIYLARIIGPRSAR